MTDRHKAAQRRARRRARARGVEVLTPRVGRGPGTHTERFLAIDGEGGNVNGRHEYTLLVAAGKGYANNLHTGGKGLSTNSCLEFILSLPKNRTLISFYFNYDVSMMLRQIDRETLAYLIDRDARTTYAGKTIPVEWAGYELDWIPGKLFKVRKRETKASRIIYDTAGFFQSSFVSALEGWNVGDAEERDFIEKMKLQRSDFTGAVTDEVIAYATQECVLLCKLMDLVYRESHSLGFHLRTFSGAGSLANAILDKWGVGDMVGTLPTEVNTAASYAYFGGRFEAAAIGEVPGPIYEYDINSAYPAAMSTLPCLACGKWTHAVEPPLDVEPMPNHKLRLYRLRWDFPNDHFTGEGFYPDWLPFPWRNDFGSICYPADGEGWYWYPEVAAAVRAGFADYIEVLETWEYATLCEHYPFAEVPRLYEHRKLLKKEGHQGEKVIKLGINSLYGKTAQTVGSRKFASPVWAGMITSRTRAQLIDATTVKAPDGMPAVVMVATDAVYSRVSMLGALPLGNNLGEWEGHLHDNMLIVQPGLYALNVESKKAVVRKTRGIRKTSFTATDVLQVWRRDGISGQFSVPVHAFVGLRRGLVSVQHEIGSWIDEERVISFFPRIKRLPIVVPNDAGISYLSALNTTHECDPSARYAKAVLSEQEVLSRLMLADDGATPDPEWLPGHIMGFAHPDFKT